jgi:hypothetical protein
VSNYHVSPNVATEMPASIGLTDYEYAILRATRTHSLSTISVAEAVGLSGDLPLVVSILDHLERLNLIDGFFAAGMSLAGPGEVHRRYYRTTDLGRRITAATA